MNKLLPPHSQWKTLLKSEFQKPYMIKLETFLKAERHKNKNIFPASNLIFEALKTTPFGKVKVIIVGQDPYHGPNQAHGLSFSVPEGSKIPPSLRNIYKELYSDLKIPPSPSGSLYNWASQGVLLINSTLTVEQGKAGSHQKKGWETFTDKALTLLNEQKRPLVFILWGSFAQKKCKFINTAKHLVLKSAHPSPLSSYRGFWGSKPFSKTNNFLINTNQTPIDWKI